MQTPINRQRLGRRPYLGPSPRTRMTPTTLAKLVKSGFGQGRAEFYQPWIRVRRAASSPVSTQHIFNLPGLGRPLHLLSGLEQRTAALAGYLGAIEVREQVPVHAEAEQHPGYDPLHQLSTRNSNRLVPGLLQIAEETGIDPGRYPGTDIVFVLTTDLVLTVEDGPGFKLVYWPVKPRSQLDGVGSQRRRERLELERRRAMHAGAEFRLITDQTVSKDFMFNLLGHKPWERDLLQLRRTDSLLRFAEEFNLCKDAKLAEAWKRAGSAAKFELIESQRRAFDVALWLGLLDIHLSKPIAPHLPIQWGGFEQRRKLRQALLGMPK